MKKVFFLILLLLFYSGIASAQLYRLENNQKLGFNAIVMDGASIYVKQISTNSEAIKSSIYNGGTLFYERIIKSQYGFQFAGGTLRRNIESRILSVNSSIEENITALQLAGRSYFSRHRNQGINLQVGAEVNYYMIESKFIVANSALANKKSNASLLAYGIFGGFDWLVKNAGVRFNVGYIFGGRADNKEIPDIHVQYEFNSLYVQFGTFAFY